jgi:hypothetical protein
MNATAIKKYTSINFLDYLNFQGHSFSSLKNEGKKFEPTEKMKLGSAVDAALFTPENYDGSFKEVVMPLIYELKKNFGNALSLGNSQVSITANFEHEDLLMNWKGRPDLIIGDLIVDLKVSELPIIKAIQYFRYDWQLTGYMAGSGCTRALICSIHPKTKKITMIPIPPVYDWWEYQIKKHGIPINLNAAYCDK